MKYVVWSLILIWLILISFTQSKMLEAQFYTTNSIQGLIIEHKIMMGDILILNKKINAINAKRINFIPESKLEPCYTRPEGFNVVHPLSLWPDNWLQNYI